MPVETTYALVLKAIDIAQKRTWKPESVRAVESARDAWYWKYIQPYPYYDFPRSFVEAQSVTRRSWKKPSQAWAHLSSPERGLYAIAQVYNLLTNLLSRVKYNPRSLTPAFWFRFLEELTDARGVMRDAYGPSPEPEPAFIREFVQGPSSRLEALAQSEILPDEEVPEWLARIASLLEPSSEPEVGGDA